MTLRRDPTGNGNNNNEVPAYMHQLLQGQAQLIQFLTQNMGNNNNHAPPPPPPPPLDTLARFLRLNPQRFSSTPEPIVADDWIRLVNRNMETIGRSEERRVGKECRSR